MDRRLGKASIILIMKPGSKYYPLFTALQRSGADEVTLTLEQIERLLGHPLPPSARTRRAWWSNRSSPLSQAATWMNAGYHVTHIDLDAGQITFSKPIFKYEIRREGDTVLWNAKMIKALRYHMKASQSELAEQLGVRQQTVSEWETETYAPKKAMSKLLSYVAERAGFKYDSG